MKKVLKIVLGLIVIVVVGGMLSSGGSDSKGSQSKPKWNMNFEDPISVAENIGHAVELMKRMDNVAANAQKVSASDVVNNLEQYMGQVLQFGAHIEEIDEAPPGSGAAKAFGGSAHAVVATTQDGVTVIATRKGDRNSSGAVGSPTVIIGMPIAITDLPGVGKVLMIAGNPK